MDYRGRFVYDTSKPNGQPRRLLSVERAEQLLGWHAQTSFEEGLRKTIAWWREQSTMTARSARSSPASPARTARTWPSCCSTRATRSTASSAARRRSTPSASTTSTRIRTSPTIGCACIYGDLNDASSLNRILRTVKPDEIYNLGAQTHVRVSFDVPEYTAEVTGLGTVRLLEAIRESGISPRFYQASSSELFGRSPAPQTETTPFHPRSPYAVRQGLRLLDHGELPRGLRHVRLQRHPLQPREPAPRRDLRDAQDHARRRRASSSACRTSSSSATSTPSATGASPATTSRRCGSCCSRTSPTTSSSPPARCHTVREFLDEAFGHARPRLEEARRDRPALLPPRRGRRAARRHDQGQDAPQVGAQGEVPRAGAR